MQIKGTTGAWPRSRDLLLNFETPLYLQRLQLQTLNVVQIRYKEYCRHDKGTIGAWPRSGDLRLHISGTAEATAFKFGVQIDYKEYCRKLQNKGQRDSLSHVTYV